MSFVISYYVFEEFSPKERSDVRKFGILEALEIVYLFVSLTVSRFQTKNRCLVALKNVFFC